MEELGATVCVVLSVTVCIYLILCVFDDIAQNDMDSNCRDNGYPDAVHIRNQGWYCVSISESKEPFLVKFEEATVRK